MAQGYVTLTAICCAHDVNNYNALKFSRCALLSEALPPQLGTAPRRTPSTSRKELFRRRRAGRAPRMAPLNTGRLPAGPLIGLSARCFAAGSKGIAFRRRLQT